MGPLVDLLVVVGKTVLKRVVEDIDILSTVPKAAHHAV